MIPGGGLAILVAAAGALVALFGRRAIGGVAPAEAATFLFFAAAALALTGRAADRARGPGGAALTAVTLWLCGMTFLGAAYGHRASLTEGAASLAESAGLGSPEPETGGGGEVTITRRGPGGFVVPARINDTPTRFVFDTGASTVVITQDTATLLGIKAESLAFRVPVGTANGVALAAPVTLDSVAVGSITIRRVRALVVRPGMLAENLLGQTFLERLASYEVRGRRLVFRAAGS